MNADLPHATIILLQKERTTDDNNSKILYDWDDTLVFSSGVNAFHWCINRLPEEHLLRNNVNVIYYDAKRYHNILH